MDARDLIHMQITLEYQLDPDGLLAPFAGSSEQARYVVYRHGNGYLCYYRHDLPERLRAPLAGLDPALAFQEPGDIRRRLAVDGMNQSAGIFRSYYFLRPPAPGDFQDAHLHKECFVIKVQGEAAAWAWSERSNAHWRMESWS